MRFVLILKYIFISLPWIFGVSLFSFAFHARLYLGYWPGEYRPDPKDLPFYEFYSLIIDYSLGLWILSWIPAIFLTFLFLDVVSFKSNRKWAYLFGNIIAVISFSLFFGWYLD